MTQMCEVPIRIPTGGKDVRVVVLGERQEKFGGVTRSENDERVMQDRSYFLLRENAVCQPDLIRVQRKMSSHWYT